MCVASDGSVHKMGNKRFSNFVVSPSCVKGGPIKDGWVCRKGGKNK